MHNWLWVDVIKAFADLSHKDSTGLLSENKIVVNDPLKQLASFDATKR